MKYLFKQLISKGRSGSKDVMKTNIEKYYKHFS